MPGGGEHTLVCQNKSTKTEITEKFYFRNKGSHNDPSHPCLKQNGDICGCH